MTLPAERRRVSVGDVTQADAVGLVTALSTIVVTLNVSERPGFFVAAAAAMVVGLARPTLLRAPSWWFATATGVLIMIGLDWEGIDNHVALTFYWALAIGCSMLAVDQRTTLATAGRTLVGLTFAIAAAWKIGSTEFVTGDSFRFFLLVDERFEHVATWLAGVSPEALDESSTALGELAQARPEATSIAVEGGPRLDLVALAATWWGIVTELAIAVAFLAPRPDRLRWLRSATLAAFCLTTYAVVPVSGFGSLLVVMALADTEPGSRSRIGLLVLFVGLIVYVPLWWLLFG